MNTATNLLLPKVLQARASDSAKKIFVQTVNGETMNYKTAFEKSCAVSNGLISLNVQKNDCVVIMADSSTESICTWLGINLAAAVDVSINTGYRGNSLEHALENSRAKILFLDEPLLDRVAEVADSLTSLETIVIYGKSLSVLTHDKKLSRFNFYLFSEILGSIEVPINRDVSSDDLASIVYTSGTTGPAKGVMMPHGQISLFAILGIEGAQMTESDIFYCFIPLYHVAGKFMGIYAMMIVGGKVVVDQHFSAEAFFPLAKQFGATLSLVHGPLIEMLYKLPESADDANNPITRLIASPFPARIAIDFQKRFAVRGIETWGMTEVTVPIWQPLDEPLRVGCCGKLREDYFEMKIVDPETDFELPMGSVGEMVLRPKYPFTIMQGYFSMPEVTISTWKNLWFHTGDLAKMDDEGYVYFADRISERIRRRAENVSSFEIEAAALSHPSITECAAVGVPSEFESDDDIKLTLVLQKGEILPPEDLMTYLIPLLPHFMVPRYLEYVNELARTPTGKILKGTLKKMGINENVWDRKSSSISIRQVIK